jgi:putative aldouronate transport system substrate-binding protein
MKRKVMTLTLAAAMLLGMLSGCGSGQTAAEAESSSTAEAVQVEEASSEVEAAAPEVPEAQSVEEPEEVSAEEATEPEIVHLVDFPIEEDFNISVSMSTTPSLTGSALIADDGSELGWAKWLEERTGAKISVDLYSFLDSSDKQNLMIASGDYTDIIVGSLNYSGGVDGAVEEDVLTDISEYAEYMPDYMNTLFQNVDNVAAAYSTDFHLTAFYGINDPDAKAEYGPVLRQDWLDELGLDTPVTYDDWHDVLTAFKDNYGATLWVTAYGGVPGDLSGGYGVMEYCGGAGFPTWTEDGEFKFAALEDEFHDYLRMMHQWYTEGLIYPDFLSQGGTDYPDSNLINNGDIGVWFTYVSYLEAEQAQLAASDAAGTIGAVAWPVVEEGNVKLETYGKLPNNAGIDGQGGFSVTTASDNIPLLCAIFNEFYTEDGYDFCNWGIEGETYTLNEDGTHAFTEVITNDEYSLGANIMMTYYFFKDGPFQYDNSRYLASYTDMQLEAATLWTTGGNNASTSTMTTDQSYDYFTAQTDISTVYQEYTVKFIVGDKDVDADWQEFIDQLYGCGLEDFMELGQAGIDQYADRFVEVQKLHDEYMNS